MDNFVLGRFEFTIALRDLGDDGGLSIHVFGPVGTHRNCKREEVLRFDCFKQQPHYHLAWSYRNDPFVPIVDSDPFTWALQKLSTEMNELLQAASAQTMTEAELDGLAKVLDAVRHRGMEIAAAA